ncbi:MAG: AsmA-like C-terminal region-containing protein [Puniceicoccales bacterium]|jgi:hypothetical protein|nr:AsmA-like C-terminal region-containing protein [Puniceicoccales bacterium]
MSFFSKKIRRILLGFLALALLAAGGTLFYFTRPGVQRDIVLNALHEQGLDASLSHVSFGLTGVSLKDFALQLPEAHIACREAHIDVSWPALLLHDFVRISSSKIEGLDVDFSKKKLGTKPKASSKRTRMGSFETWGIRIENTTITDSEIHTEDGTPFELSANSSLLELTCGDAHFTLTEKAPDGRTLKGSLSLHFAPLSHIPASLDEILSLKPSISANATLSAPGPNTARATLSIETSVSDGEKKYGWTLLLGRAEKDTAPTHLSGKIACDGAFTAKFDFRDFSTNHFASLLGNTARYIPEVRALSGTLDATHEAGQTAQARFNLSGAATHLNRAHKSLDGLGTLNASLAGTVTLPNLAKPQSWKLALTRLNLRTAENKPLLDAAANINAAPSQQYAFSLSAIVFTNGLAAQPAWRELLAKFTADDWRGKLAATGALQLAPGTPTGNVLKLSAASLAVARNANTKPILSLALLQPFDSSRPLNDSSKPLLRASTNAFPLELATPFLGGARISGAASGEMNFWQNAGKAHLASEPDKPLTLHALSYSDASGKARLDKLHLRGEIKFTCETSLTNSEPTVWQLDISKARANADNENPLDGSLSLAWRDGVQDIRAKLKGDPSHLLRQPLLGGFDNFASAKLELNGNYTRDGTCTLQLELNDLTGRGNIGSLPRLTMKASGIFSPPKTAFTMPAVLQGKTHTSDLLLTISASDGKPWAAKLDGQQIHALDLQSLVALFTPSEITDTEDEHSPKNKKEHAFWAWMGEGSLSLALGKIILPYPPQVAAPAENDTATRHAPKLLFEDELPAVKAAPIANTLPKILPPLVISGATATVGVRKSSLTLHSSALRIDDSTLNTTGHLKYQKDQPEPYSLSANASVRSVPFRDWLERFKPEAANTIEGRFNATATLNATAKKRKSILKNLELQALLTSQNGRIRVLKMDNDTVRALGDLTDLAGGLVDIVEGFKPHAQLGKKKAPLQAFRQIQDYLNDFPFEQAELRLRRERNGDVVLERLLIRNESLLMQGSGNIANQPGLALADCPLNLQAGFSARGSLADLLSELKVLYTEKDANGYRAGPRFQIDGTLNGLQTDLLATLLKAAQDSMLRNGSDLVPKADAAIRAGRSLLHDFGL